MPVHAVLPRLGEEDGERLMTEGRMGLRSRERIAKDNFKKESGILRVSFRRPEADIRS